MTSNENANVPGLIEPRDYGRTELHGFEIDMSGRIIVPEFHPCAPEHMAALIEFESGFQAATEAAA